MFHALRFSNWFVILTLTSLLVAVVGIGVGPAFAAPITYYIDCVGGSDANNGTSTSTPWRTFANVNGRVFVAGDSILLKRGTTCSGIGGLAPEGNGTSTSPITIGAYGTGTAPFIQAGLNHGVQLVDQAGWVVQDLHISTSRTGEQHGSVDTGFKGIFLDSSLTQQSYFRLLNLEIHDTFDGMQIGRYKPKNEMDNGYLDDVVIDNAYIHDSAGAGIEVSGNWAGGATAGDNTIRNTNVTIRNSIFGDLDADGVIATGIIGGLIETSVAYRTGLNGDDRYGLWFWNSRNVTLQLNETYDNRTATTKGGGGYDCDYHVENCVAQYNYGHDDLGAGILLIGKGNENLLGCTVRYNIFEREGVSVNNNGVILPFGSVDNCKVYNNTIYFNNPVDISSGILAWTWGGFGQAHNNLFRNNIFYLANGATGAHIESPYTGNGNSYDNNLWYSTDGNLRIEWGTTNYGTPTYTTLAAWCSGAGQECNGVQANPLFTAVNTGPNGYTLQAGSPAINRGVVLDGNNGGRDYFGNGVPQGGAPDLGAIESGGGGGPTATPVPPTNTPTSGPTATPTRTNTPVPPTNTPTAGPSPTPTRTNTPIPPTNTPTAGPTATRTNTPVPTNTPGGSETSFATGVTIQGPLRNDFNGFLGMKITVGGSAINVTQLGRYFISGNSGTHTLRIVRASDSADLGSISINMSAGTADGLGFKYASLASPVTLAANTIYYIVSQEVTGGDTWYGSKVQGHPILTTTGVATINAAIYQKGSNSWATEGSTGESFIPVNFKYN